MAQFQSWQWIPTHLSLEQFEEFVLPHLHIGSRGPQPKLALHVIFNYILKLLYLGVFALTLKKVKSSLRQLRLSLFLIHIL